MKKYKTCDFTPYRVDDDTSEVGQLCAQQATMSFFTKRLFEQAPEADVLYARATVTRRKQTRHRGTDESMVQWSHLKSSTPKLTGQTSLCTNNKHIIKKST